MTETVLDNRGARGDVETAFSVRKTAWGGGAVLADTPKTAAEALEAAGLNWNVVKIPSWRRSLTSQEFVQVPDRYQIVRDSDDKDLGSVGKAYEPFQNAEAFDFLDGLAHGGEIFYETAGSLNGGKRIWVMCRVPETITIAGGDTLAPYLCVMASHDGSSAVTAAATAVRIECTNSYNMALSGVKNRYTFRHTTAGSLKLQEARETLKLQVSWDEALKIELDKLVAAQISDDTFQDILKGAFPDMKNQTPKSIEAVINNRHESPTIQDEYRPTAWGALNALSEWTEHLRPYRDQEAREKAVLVGWASKMINQVSGDLRTFALQAA